MSDRENDATETGPQESEHPQKRRRGCGTIFKVTGCLSAILLAIWFIMNLPQPVRDGKPLMRVSPETTHIVEPLDENGGEFHAWSSYCA